MTKETPTPGPHHVEIAFDGNYVKAQDKSIICLSHRLEDALLHAAAFDLLEAAKAQHQAIDWLMARLIELDSSFMPTKSRIWPALVQGNAAITKATLTSHGHSEHEETCPVCRKEYR